ncbi:MAG TPA: hypothetical protein VGI00_21945 [Streptosporangiaceae bacterium]|jgi:hypothetical protein
MVNPAPSALRDQDMRLLDDLDRAWGQAYDLAVIQGRWVACGLSTGRWLDASSAAELRRLIAADAAGR